MSTNKPDLATALIHHAYEPPAGFAAPQPLVSTPVAEQGDPF